VGARARGRPEHVSRGAICSKLSKRTHSASATAAESLLPWLGPDCCVAQMINAWLCGTTRNRLVHRHAVHCGCAVEAVKRRAVVREIVAEPQMELEQESALGPSCDVASLASLIMDLDAAALA
jgi:hypothetical protein